MDRISASCQERLKKDDTLTAQSETDSRLQAGQFRAYGSLGCLVRALPLQVTSAAERWCQEHDGMNGISNGDGMPGSGKPSMPLATHHSKTAVSQGNACRSMLMLAIMQ